MNEGSKQGHPASEMTYAAGQFGVQHGERWRRFLERVGTHSNDFAARLSRARFVYLHRRETGSQWFAIGVLVFCWLAEASMCAERGF